MAEFCYHCWEKMGGDPEKNDLCGLVQKGQLTFELCEGCGLGWFDYEGKKVAEPETDC